MDISPLQAPSGTPGILDKGELPPGPPMPMDSSWVKSMQLMFSKENPEVICKHASNLLANMQRILSNQINRDAKKAKETAQRWRDAILGR
jgi:hypothetical protein